MEQLTKKAIYNMEQRLIKRHFSGLKPRPIKIDNEMQAYGRAGDDALSLNLKLHKSKREIEETLIHELIHYELKDSGEFCGHGRAFVKRAKELGILGLIELSQCVTLEEEEQLPHTVQYITTPLAKYAAVIDEELSELRDLSAKISNLHLRLRFYRIVRSIEIGWQFYRSAVKDGRDYVEGEKWKRRKGPRGKSMPELLREREELQKQITSLKKQLFDGAVEESTYKKAIRPLIRREDKISEKLRRDFNID